MNPRSLFRFFISLPVIAFRIAGLLRITSQAKRDFKRVLKAEGLPGDVVEELGERFTPQFSSLFKR